MIEVSLTPLRNGLSAGVATRTEVLIRLSASPAPLGGPLEARPALNLSLVIDRSGSMSGQPLDEAKRCAGRIVDRLAPKDRLAIVTYDSRAETVVPSRLVADRGAFHAAIREIGPGGQTALHDGWHMGATQVAQHLRTDAIARVLLLSDGCANQGLTDPEAIRRHCGTLADTGISTSTYGLGSGFNEDLMSAMARDGQGQAHYGQTAEDLMELFDEEFSLLDALVARRLRLRLDPAPGVQARVLNGYRHEQDGRVILPDLPRDGDVWALVELDIPAQATGGGPGAPAPLLGVAVDFCGMDGVPGPAMTGSLALPIVDAALLAALPPDEAVSARSTELRAAALQRQARTAAQRGDWDRVDGLIDEIRKVARGNEWILASIEPLRAYARQRDREHFAKEAQYKSMRMMYRLARRDDGAAFSAEAERDRPAFLRRKSEQGKRSEP